MNRISLRTSMAIGMLLAAGTLATAQCPGPWSLVSGPGPSPRQNHAAAFDAARGVVVLFGGYQGGVGFNAETWTWNGTAWTLRAVPGPSARGNHTMCYDSVRARIVLFGGFDGVLGLNDTWEWNGAAWVQMAPATSPDIRFNHAMAFDSGRGKTVMTGGFGGAGNNIRFNETWEWDGANWVNRGLGPAAQGLTSAAMAYDAFRAKTVVFGGFFGGVRQDKTYEFNGTTWSQIVTPGPIARQYLNMDYNPDRHEIVLFGGQSGACSTCRENDTWVYNGAWTLIRPTDPASAFDPSRRDQHTVTYFPPAHKTMVFGGYEGNAVVLSDTWVSGCSGCYPNCDNSTTAPILNALDFGCFLTKFAASDTYANCDGSSAAPILNALDFGCFLTKFAGGCT